MSSNFFTKMLVGKDWRKTALRIVPLALIVIVVCKLVYMPFITVGKSMEPTVMDKRLVFVDKLAYRSKAPQRGDIVAIRMAGEKVSLLKRIVGLPGEVISIKNGIVHINGQVFDETYMVDKGDWNLKDQHLDIDQYFVIGDNRSMPIFQHKFGKTEKRRIIGKML